MLTNSGMALVLVVDDDADVRASVTDALLHEGYEVAEAEDGERALDEIIRRPPDVILLDLRMPRWSGRDFLDALRHALPAPARPYPIVVVTASADTARTARELGIHHLVHKPFALKDLLGKIQQALTSG